jgi:D-alanine-D-alanine ligase
MRARLADLAEKAGEAIGACDVSRVDIRLGADGRPYLLEINTLPGLMPEFSDLCIVSGAEGMPYHVLITEILYLAAQRYGLPFEVQADAQRLPAAAFAQSLARA